MTAANVDPDAPEGTAAQRLATAPLTVIGRFEAASNATLLVGLGDATAALSAGDLDLGAVDGEGLAVYKPVRGEAPLWDFPDGTLHRREVAAYRVDRALGWQLVPLTVLRGDGPFGGGSIQRFVPHDPSRHYFALLEEGAPSVLHQLARMVVFDLIVNNADRKAGHVLVERVAGPPRCRLVDHGVTFHTEPKLRTVAWHLAGEAIPADVRSDVTHLVGALETDLADELGELLSAAEVVALRDRARTVATAAAYPAPTGRGAYPWPLV